MELLQFNACPNDPVIHARGTPLFLSESCHLTGDRRGSLRKSRGETSERLKKSFDACYSCHFLSFDKRAPEDRGKVGERSDGALKIHARKLSKAVIA